MHILKIIHGYPPLYNAGSEVYSQSICTEFSKNHKVSVFTREENPYMSSFSIRQENRNPNLNLYIINNPNGKDGYRHKAMDEQFAALLDKLKPDIAHIGHLNHLSTGIVDELYKRHIPIIFTLHDFWLMCPRGQFLTRSNDNDNNFRLCTEQHDKKCACDCYGVYFGGGENDLPIDIKAWSDWIHRRMVETKAIVEKTNLFIAPSRYLRNRFIQDFGISESKIIYMDYGFPTEYLKPISKHKSHNKFTFGYIGTHIPAKGVNQLIKAFKKIKDSAALKIFGRENGQSTVWLKNEAAFLKDKIEFCGEYDNHNVMHDVFEKVDCIVVPSIWAENSPLVIHEAQSCKIPVITADYGGMSEYVRHNINGLLFEHRNVDSLAGQMNFAAEHPDIMRHLGDRGYLYSADGNVPDIQFHCRELVKLYEQFIG
ncbi:MAG: glycosyltransferase [Spirochaetaceae bacterium]|jgi:glycosyltransferase involved in cell wall biosynthesis|nr:glycosyltransferase [Spirochaetaceae bacterium]